jgi:hypothetical protein
MHTAINIPGISQDIVEYLPNLPRDLLEFPLNGCENTTQE